MYLYLVRHGESTGNAQKLFFGHTDYPLTPLGCVQARQVAEKLSHVPFSRCCASDLSRAWKTAQICLTQREIWPEKCPALREQFMGNLEEKTWDEAVQMYGHALEDYLNNWYNETIPGMESPKQMEHRVNACLMQILAQGEDTLIVAHNGTLILILKLLGLIDDEQLNDMYFQFRFGCYTAIRVDANGAVLEGFNL